MAGIYLHIPFCKKACHYCDFHFSVSLRNKNELIACLLKEIETRVDYLPDKKIESIYFGGGTPSLLNQHELASLLEQVHKYYDVATDAECTLEANPDDLHAEKIKMLQTIGINRLSIGIQSFFDEDLAFMNRSHNAAQALQCVGIAQDGGIDTISIDLIFGFPLLSDLKWQQNIETAIATGVPHLSCYAMTVEPKTALALMIQKQKTAPVNTEQSASQFEYLNSRLERAQYESYEISNFALKGKWAIHNTNYWKGIPYLGIGPSAHSYDGYSRQWNVANNIQYIRSIEEGTPMFEKEILTETQRLNEFILTSLRMIDGIPLEKIKKMMPSGKWDEWMQKVKSCELSGKIYCDNESIRLTRDGRLFADYIAAELFDEN